MYVPLPIGRIEERQEQTSRTYQLDLKRGRIYSVGSADEVMAVRQAITKALITPRYDCTVYDNQYGSEIRRAILAEDVTQAYMETSIPRLVRDALSVDTRILDVYDFSMELNGDEVIIEFAADTIFGTMNIREVL